MGHSAWEGGRRGGAQGGGWQCHGGGFFSLRSNFQPGINSLTARCRRSGCLSCWPGEPTKLGWVWESQIQVCALPASKPRRCPRCPSCHWRGFDALRAAEKAHVWFRECWGTPRKSGFNFEKKKKRRNSLAIALFHSTPLLSGNVGVCACFSTEPFVPLTFWVFPLLPVTKLRQSFS